MHHRNSWSYIGEYTKSKMKKDMGIYNLVRQLRIREFKSEFYKIHL